MMKTKATTRYLIFIFITFLLLFQVGCDDDQESVIIEAAGHYIRLYSTAHGESGIGQIILDLTPSDSLTQVFRTGLSLIPISEWMNSPHWETWQQLPVDDRPRWSDAYVQYINSMGTVGPETRPSTAASTDLTSSGENDLLDSVWLGEVSLAGEWEGTMTFQQHQLKTLPISAEAGFEEMIAQVIKELFVLMFDEMTGVPLKLVLSFAETDGGNSEIYRAATKIVVPDRVNNEINRKWIEKEGGPADPFQPPMTNTQATIKGRQVYFSTLFFEDESGTTFVSQPKLDFTGGLAGRDSLSGTFILQGEGEEIGRGVWECRRID